MRHALKTVAGGLVAVGLALGIAACSNDGYVSVGVTASALASDGAPAGDPAHLRVTVTEVKLKFKPCEKRKKGDKQGRGWRTVFTGSQSVDLFDLVDTQRLLGGVSVPAGRVKEIRFVLADDVALLEDGMSVPVKCPSCSTSGLKLKMKKMCVGAGETLDLTASFDLTQGLALDVDGMRLHPVVKLRGAHGGSCKCGKRGDDDDGDDDDDEDEDEDEEEDDEEADGSDVEAGASTAAPAMTTPL